jgi:hypothetical protein
MGMFDYIRCGYPLPLPQYQHEEFQTKDTPAQFLDHYEIMSDGTLTHQTYDIEDRSDPNAEGLMRIVGMITRVNPKWETVDFTGEIRFYTSTGEKPQEIKGLGVVNQPCGWVEFSAYFLGGKLNQLNLIIHDEC